MRVATFFYHCISILLLRAQLNIGAGVAKLFLTACLLLLNRLRVSILLVKAALGFWLVQLILPLPHFVEAVSVWRAKATTKWPIARYTLYRPEMLGSIAK